MPIEFLTMDIRPYFTIKRAVKVDQRRQFAGRSDVIRKSLDALAVEESPLILYGERGVGKTSLGWQLLAILSGNDAILKERRINTIHPIEKRKCLWLTCANFMNNIPSVIFSLLRETDPDYSFQKQFPSVFSDNSFLRRIAQNYKLDLGIFSATFDVGRPVPSARKVSEDMEGSNLKYLHLLKEMLIEIRVKYPDEKLLIFLDEFDQVEDRTPIGVLLTIVNDAQFVIIGISDTLDKLIGDHPSIRRKFTNAFIEVPLLAQDESNWFYEEVAASSRNKISFDNGFKRVAYTQSSGFPWLIQQFGFYSCQTTLEKNVGVPIQNLRNGVAEFNQMLPELVQKELGNEDFDLGKLTKTQRLILKVLTKRPYTRINEDQLISLLPREYRAHFDRAVPKLEEIGILSKSQMGVRFSDPIQKILATIANDQGKFEV